jgi:hypothetical protein
MKLERRNFSTAMDTEEALTQLERTMLASIAMMKRLRRARKRSGRLLDNPVFEQKSNQSAEVVRLG